MKTSTNEKVVETVERGPKELQLAEAEWLIASGQIELSKPARKAFELGVALASGPAHREWVASETYVKTKERLRNQQGSAYALSGTPRNAPVKTATAKAAPNGAVLLDGLTAADVRDWATKNGHKVSSRGRLSAEIIEAFIAAKATPAKKSSAKPARSGDTGARAARDEGRRSRRRRPAGAVSAKVEAPAKQEMSPRVGRERPAPRRTRQRPPAVAPLAGEAEF